MTIQQAIQAKIDARQDYDALVYALRTGGSDIGQATEGQKVAERLLGKCIYRYDAFELNGAKKLARETLQAAEAALKEYGTKRQLRLALAEAA